MPPRTARPKGEDTRRRIIPIALIFKEIEIGSFIPPLSGDWNIKLKSLSIMKEIITGLA
jgi:hypothetical protein